MSRPTAGFTLIEVVVATGLLSVLVGFFGALAQISSLNSGTKYQDVALRIASSELEVLRAGDPAAIPQSGTFSDPLLASLPSGADTIDTSAYATGIKTVHVSVSWQNETHPQTISLTTLIADSGGLQL